jgi:hypothetical protein
VQASGECHGLSRPLRAPCQQVFFEAPQQVAIDGVKFHKLPDKDADIGG